MSAKSNRTMQGKYSRAVRRSQAKFAKRTDDNIKLTPLHEFTQWPQRPKVNGPSLVGQQQDLFQMDFFGEYMEGQDD